MPHLYEDGCGPFPDSGERDAARVYKFAVEVRLAQLQDRVNELCPDYLADTVVNLFGLVAEPDESLT